MPIVAAAPAAPIEQPARDVGGQQLAGFLVLELVDAAFAASVAQRLPLRAIELRERRILPEPPAHLTHRSISAATASGPLSIGSGAIGLP